MKRQKLTVIIPTYNCEDILEHCIKSVLWADEILVVDSFSTDNTLKIARKYKCRILQHEYIYSAKQKNWAIPKAKHNWILLVDSDERVMPALKQEIQNLLKRKMFSKGYFIARRHYFLDKWMRFGGRYPLYNIRLFSKKCRYEDRNVHAHILLDKSKCGYLQNDIIHLSDRSLSQYLHKANRYTTYQANYMAKTNKKGIKINWKDFFTNYMIFKATIKDMWYFIPGSSFARFLYMYIFKLGFLDGWRGFIIAFLYGFDTFVAKIKYYEIMRKKKKAPKGLLLNTELKFANKLVATLERM